MTQSTRLQNLLALPFFTFLILAGSAQAAITGSDGTEQLGSGQSDTSETDAQLQISYDPEPKVSSVHVQSNGLTLTGSDSSSGSVDIGDLNVADGFDLTDAFNVVISYSDTATSNELVNLQASLLAATPSGVSIAVEMDTADIPAENNTLADGSAGSAAGVELALTNSTLADLVTDLDDNDTTGSSVGDSGSIVLPIDLKVDVDSTVASDPGNFTIKFRALFE